MTVYIFDTFLYINIEKGKKLMAKVIAIEGGYKLNGTVRISGAKNATVALIPAAVLSDGPVEILGVPEISDVEALAILLEELKCKVEVDGERIRIDPTHMEDIPLVSDAVNKLRASYYFMGALLGKYKRVKIKMPGGCYLGPRPIDLHLKGFEALGAKITYENDTYLLEAEELVGTSIYLDFASVGATINIMLAAVRAKGKTIIENAAKEPEIIDVANLLTKMGAKIRGVGTDTITIEGVDYLGGTFHEIIPDRIEAGTFLIIAAAAGERVIIQNIIPQHLEALISKLKEMGVKMDVVGDSIVVYGAKEGLKPVDVIITSGKKNLNLDTIYDAIDTYRKGRDVYVVGMTNVGKSTFINALLKHYAGVTDNLITTSEFPGTTLDLIEITTR